MCVMCMHVFTHVHISEGAKTWEHVYRCHSQKLMSSIFLNCSPPYILRQSLSLVSQLAPGIPVCPSLVLGWQVGCHGPGGIYMSVDLNSGPLMCKANPTEPSSQPPPPPPTTLECSFLPKASEMTPSTGPFFDRHPQPLAEVDSLSGPPSLASSLHGCCLCCWDPWPPSLHPLFFFSILSWKMLPPHHPSWFIQVLWLPIHHSRLLSLYARPASRNHRHRCPMTPTEDERNCSQREGLGLTAGKKRR